MDQEKIELIKTCPRCKRSIVGGWFQAGRYVYGCECGYRTEEPKGKFLFYPDSESAFCIIVKRNANKKLQIVGA